MSCLSLLLATSIHFGLEGKYNQIHPHARCTIGNTITGIYYNSENKISSYVGYKFGILEIGAVTGYQKTILPMLRIIKNGWFLSPALETKQTKNNWGFTFGYELPLRF